MPSENRQPKKNVVGREKCEFREANGPPAGGGEVRKRRIALYLGGEKKLRVIRRERRQYNSRKRGARRKNSGKESGRNVRRENRTGGRRARWGLALQ